MRVLYFHQYFTTPKGVGGNRSYWMATALKNAGHDVHIVCANSPNGDTGIDLAFHHGKRSAMVEGIKVTEFELNYNNRLSFIKRTIIFLKFALYSIKIAMRDHYDVAFCSSTPLTASIPGLFSRWLRRKTFVLEIRDLWPELPREMGVITNPLVLFGMSVLEWVSYRSAHACIGLSPGIVAGIKKRNKSDQPVAMLPNGCDIGLFDQTSEYETIDIDGIVETDFVAIFIGAHGIANGLDAVLDAASELVSDHANIKFLFLGDGNQKDGLVRRKEQENLSNCIFLPPVAKNKLDAYMARADVGLMVLKNVPAFYYGTSPNKFFDYLSAGKPILNNYPGWLADIITEHQLGRAVSPDDPAAFANALVQLSRDQNKLRNMGLCSARLAHTQFNRSVIAADFVNFMETQQQLHKVN